MVVITNRERERVGEVEEERESSIIIFLVAILFCLYAIKSTRFTSHDHCAWWCTDVWCFILFCWCFHFLFRRCFFLFTAFVSMCNSLAMHSQKYVDIVIIRSHTYERTNKRTKQTFRFALKKVKKRIQFQLQQYSPV